MSTRHPTALSVILVLLLAAGVTACGEGPADAPEEPAGGPVATGETGDLQISADSIRILGTSEGLTLVRDLEIAPDGTIWVLDAEPPYLVAFDPDGPVRAEMGMPGDGPREFGMPVTLVASDGGAIDAGLWVFDRGRHAMVRVTMGTSVSEDPSLPEVLASETVRFPVDRVPPQSLLSREGAMPSPIAWVGAGGASVYVVPAVDGPARGPAYWTGTVVELSLETGEAHERWAMADYLPEPGQEYAGITQFMPSPAWAICPTDGAWMYDPVRHEVRPLGDPDGAGISLPAPRREAVTPDRMFELLVPRMLEQTSPDQRPPDDQLREAFDAEVGQRLHEFAEHFPEYFQMYCGADGSLWLQHFHWREGHWGAGWRWDRVPADRRATGVAMVGFPEGFRAFRFTADRAWGIVRDEFDIPSVAWVPLP